MAARAELAKLERDAAEVMAAQQIEEMNGVRRDDVLNSDTKSEARSLGLGSAGVKATNDADRQIVLYHAYDGRELPVPKYMAPRYITTLFKRGDQEVPEEYWGKPVWSINADYAAGDDSPREFTCRLSPGATAEVKTEMKAAGLAMTCRKRVRGGGYLTQFEADEHFRKKHPRRWAAYQRYLGRADTARSADAMTTAVDAMRSILEKLAT